MPTEDAVDTTLMDPKILHDVVATGEEEAGDQRRVARNTVDDAGLKRLLLLVFVISAGSALFLYFFSSWNDSQSSGSSSPLSVLDWLILVAYIGGMMYFSYYLGSKQNAQSSEDYYVGGRDLQWWAVGVSTMATQTSAISFMSIPAFVGLKVGGGLTWLQYEVSLPLAAVIVMHFLLPTFRRMELVSVYEFMERRFSARTKQLLSAVFLVSRSLGTGVGLYASAVLVAVISGLGTTVSVTIVAVLAVLYDYLGGMTAVVYTDVIQMTVLVAGLVGSIALAVAGAGGLAATLSLFPASRFHALDARSDGFSPSCRSQNISAPNASVPTPSSCGQDAGMSFWAFFFGGVVLYSSYYGTDQSQVQRMLSSKSVNDARWSMVLNGVARMPLTLLYCFFGVALRAFWETHPEFAALVPQEGKTIDALVPTFIVKIVPTGLRAVLVASILSAALSSLDSNLNALSAATQTDFLHNRSISPRFITVVWGGVITVFALLAGGISDTVVEGINRVGSVFYGPVLAAFIMGLLWPTVNDKCVLPPACVFVAMPAGVVLNVVLWLTTEVHWMWYNVVGCAVSLCIALAWGMYTRKQRVGGWAHSEGAALRTADTDSPRRVSWALVYVMLLVYCGLLVALLIGFNTMAD